MRERNIFIQVEIAFYHSISERPKRQSDLIGDHISHCVLQGQTGQRNGIWGVMGIHQYLCSVHIFSVSCLIVSFHIPFSMEVFVKEKNATHRPSAMTVISYSTVRNMI